jgi:hypothetical protein
VAAPPRLARDASFSSWPSGKGSERPEARSCRGVRSRACGGSARDVFAPALAVCISMHVDGLNTD